MLKYSIINETIAFICLLQVKKNQIQLSFKYGYAYNELGSGLSGLQATRHHGTALGSAGWVVLTLKQQLNRTLFTSVCSVVVSEQKMYMYIVDDGGKKQLCVFQCLTDPVKPARVGGVLTRLNASNINDEGAASAAICLCSGLLNQ